MPVSIRDVAEKAGVSTGTVSKALNGVESRVPQTTRERIQQVAVELGYSPNSVASSLRRQRTNLIGFYSGHPTINPRVIPEILGGLQDGCEEFHKDLVILSKFRNRAVDDIYARIVNGVIDGLVLLAYPDDPLVPRLAASHLPAVAIADAVEPLPSVVGDDMDGSRQIARYLVAKGHRRILYRRCPEPRESAFRRYHAFCAIAPELGIDVISPAPAPFPGEMTSEERAYLREPSPQRPSAIVCWNDTYVTHVVTECQGLALPIPEAIAVVGFNGNVFDELHRMRLTTVKSPWEEMARQAVELLTIRIKGGEVPRETALPVQLVVGETA